MDTLRSSAENIQSNFVDIPMVVKLKWSFPAYFLVPKQLKPENYSSNSPLKEALVDTSKIAVELTLIFAAQLLCTNVFCLTCLSKNLLVEDLYQDMIVNLFHS